MTPDESTTRVVAESGADVGPGERLREAREAAQLTVSEVASRLRLEPRVIDWLENDDYDQLHGPTFVRGYLSGYARLLDLPERPILEAYERHGFGPPALVSELGRKPEVHVSDFPVRMVTYVIAGLLVVLVVLWWQSRQVETRTPEHADAGTTIAADSASQDRVAAGADETSASTAGSSAGTADTMAPVQSQPPAAATVSESASAERQAAQAETQARATGEMQPAAETPADDGAGGGEVPTQVEPPPQIYNAQESVASVEEPLDTGAETPQPVDTTTTGTVFEDSGAEPSTATVSGGDESLPDSTQSEEVTEVVRAPLPAPLPGSDVLAIQLSRESWIEIYDRGGGRLYYSLAREGSEIVVQGAGPMRVLLGEVQGAEVAYNGEPYDLSRFEGRSVVRFTVGELSGTPSPVAPAPAATDEPPTPEAQEPTAEGEDRSVADAGRALEPPAPPPAATTPSIAPAPQAAPPTPAADPAPAPAQPDS